MEAKKMRHYEGSMRQQDKYLGAVMDTYGAMGNQFLEVLSIAKKMPQRTARSDNDADLVERYTQLIGTSVRKSQYKTLQMLMRHHGTAALANAPTNVDDNPINVDQPQPVSDSNDSNNDSNEVVDRSEEYADRLLRDLSVAFDRTHLDSC